ncbi:glycosyltransferase [Microbacterium sp. 10M-3C3]|uniref:glycosyltransferase n=1 Tax=Microbacterium sp. 10M-3C3 TaxID=2483401 RepID=UPI000F633222|nr:glycosyltransferase [Microbacterium sp. 10M-3C3]
MHVVFFGDQHVESAGGAQVSMRLQRRYLERAGHTVTVVAPRMFAPHPSDTAYIDLPAIPITPDREYSLSVPGRATDRAVDAALAGRPPVDLVHVQADFWGALIGHRFARRHGLPVVHTMHNRVDVGIAATAPFPRAVLAVLNVWARRGLPPRRRIASPDSDAAAARVRIREPRPNPRRSARDGWAYLRRFAQLSDAVTAPSAHFARRLEQHGVFPAVDVVWNGIDDAVLEDVTSGGAASRPPGRPRLVWAGRMSPEKRLLPFLEAVVESGIAADITVIGGGGQLRAARRIIERERPAASVEFAGRLPYAETLRRIAAADAMVQTSIGFETQGMTVFEAASLGTPSIVSDPDIASELGSGVWTPDDGSVAALARVLRRAAADIVAGDAPQPDPGIRDAFRQSSRTAAMTVVYERLLRTRA